MYTKVESINEIIIEAGKIALKYYHENVNISHKKDNTLVSKVDIEVEKFILKKINKLVDGAVFIGEEMVESLNEIEKKKMAEEVFENNYVWSVDPIDGTHNYATRYGDFSISIGLLKKSGNKMLPYLGAIYIPLRDTLLYTDGLKSYIVFNSSFDNAIKKEIKVEAFSEEELNRGIFITNAKKIESYNPNNLWNLRMPGGMVIGLSEVAKGGALGMTIEYEKIWDIAAGLAICKNAGVDIFSLKDKSIKDGFTINDFKFEDNSNWSVAEKYLVASKFTRDYILEEVLKS
ncbi:MAG: inositol monophosphatase family protein [Clostridia bacterium]|nr:inositol monophosphatase family protein [Clostridia bacterium]